MNEVQLHDASGAVVTEVYYPTSDGQPMAETGIHVLVMIGAIATLRALFRRRSDVYIIGNIFLYYQEGDPKKVRSPDVMVIKGVDSTPERDSFKTWEEKAVPCFILEITSPKTAKEDQEEKFELYQRLGVRDYFLFDPLHEYLERPLIGYRLIGNKYEPIQHAADGGLLSQELGVRLVPEGQELAYIHFGTGLRLPTPDHFEETLLEERQRVASAEQRSEREKQRAEAEKQRAEAEKQRAESAEQRLAALEAELARIKAAPSSTSPGQPRVTDP